MIQIKVVLRLKIATYEVLNVIWRYVKFFAYKCFSSSKRHRTESCHFFHLHPLKPYVHLWVGGIMNQSSIMRFKSVAFAVVISAILSSCDNQNRGKGITQDNNPDLTQQDNLRSDQSVSRQLVTVWGSYNPSDTSNMVRMTGIGGRSEYTISYSLYTGFSGDKLRLLESQSQERNAFCNQPSYFEISLIDQVTGNRVEVLRYQDIHLERNRNYSFQVRYRPGCNSVDWTYNPIVWFGE